MEMQFCYGLGIKKIPVLQVFSVLAVVPIPRVGLGSDPYQGPIITVILYRPVLLSYTISSAIYNHSAKYFFKR